MPQPRIEVLHTLDCPNWTAAVAAVRAALDRLDRADVPVVPRLIRAAGDAAGTAFAGSPTVTVEGDDLFPAEPSAQLACRVYATPDGLRGLPTEAQLAAALRERLGR